MSPLIRRVAGRRAVRLPTDEKIRRLWAATHALYEHDPEHFQGGCADISIALYFAAARANWTGVQVVTGVAGPPPVYPELDDAREVLERLPVEAPGGPFLHVWLSVDGHRLDPTWGLRMDITNFQYQPEATGRKGLRLAIAKHGCDVMFDERDTMLYYTDPAMPALRGEV
jgi:hypothetical protein